ncbi:hypothetical protein CC80DRAFT_598716 [Byssothecium circinans]|uniref:Uncharacterized protein n=1 Tax=Byssothecium circinans TaxID=147558 RepID=A0A6A5TDJ4_9PLEO|nr:hypothetical protein CC80DRAFT_598716 [Byssothecium circinans]
MAGQQAASTWARSECRLSLCHGKAFYHLWSMIWGTGYGLLLAGGHLLAWLQSSPWEIRPQRINFRCVLNSRDARRQTHTFAPSSPSSSLHAFAVCSAGRWRAFRMPAPARSPSVYENAAAISSPDQTKAGQTPLYARPESRAYCDDVNFAAMQAVAVAFQQRETPPIGGSPSRPMALRSLPHQGQIDPLARCSGPHLHKLEAHTGLVRHVPTAGRRASAHVW